MFRDSEGNVLLQFGKEVQVESTVQAELLAFKEEILIVAHLVGRQPIPFCSNLISSPLSPGLQTLVHSLTLFLCFT